MRRHFISAAVILAAAAGIGLPAAAEEPFWGIQAEQLEFRVSDAEEVFAWDFDALYGTDELKLVWRSEAEYGVEERALETLENQIRLQTPISDFFDAVVGFGRIRRTARTAFPALSASTASPSNGSRSMRTCSFRTGPGSGWRPSMKA